MVDFFYDGFRPQGLLNRENPIGGEKNEEEEKIRNLSTYVISGLLDKQVLPSFDPTIYAKKTQFIMKSCRIVRAGLFVRLAATSRN